MIFAFVLLSSVFLLVIYLLMTLLHKEDTHTSSYGIEDLM